MSFAKDAKLEVIKTKIDADCCSMAFLSAVIKSAGQLDISNGKKSIVIFTELKELFGAICPIIEQYYGERPSLVTEEMPNKTTRYTIYIPLDAEELLTDLGVMNLGADGYEFVDGIPEFLIKQECCKISYIKGIFVGCATSNIVIKNYDNNTKNSSGYHFEFILANEVLAQDFIKLLSHFSIPAKWTTRKNNILVYIKEYQVICDILALVGASKCVMKLQNEATIREVRNTVNRQNNCFNANLSKTLSASVRQLDAINYINKTIGISSLDAPLAELCLIRLANPDEPLENLTKLYSTPVTKSGINHRFQKIEKIAKELKEKKR